MKPEKFIGIELAKAIYKAAKENGIELPESEYTHQMQFSLSYYWTIGIEGEGLCGKDLRNEEVLEYPAYDLYELGEALHAHIRVKGDDYYLAEYSDGEERTRVCSYATADAVKSLVDIYDAEQPEARGKTYLYLIKNGLIK